jgi:hypothetical protein
MPISAMASVGPNNWTFDPADLADLEARNEIQPVFNGTRIIRRSLMTKDPNPLYSDDLVSVPIMIRSRETLQFIGFTTKSTDEMWKQWIKREITSPNNFLAFACYNIKHSKDDTKSYEDKAWLNCILSYGVCRQFVETIMNSSFKKYKLTNSAKFCALQLMETNYRILLTAQEASTLRARALAIANTPNRAPITVQESAMLPYYLTSRDQVGMSLAPGTKRSSNEMGELDAERGKKQRPSRTNDEVLLEGFGPLPGSVEQDSKVGDPISPPETPSVRPG